MHQESLDILANGPPRSSSSGAATSTTHLVYTTRLRTLATTVFIRGMAARSGKDPLPKEVEPVSLAEFKSEMTTLIDKEVKESGCMLDDAARYLSELNYTMTVNEGVATLKRTQGKHSIEISFAVEDEDDEDDEEGESDESSEEDDTEDAALQAESDLQGENGEIDGAQKTDPFAGVPGIYITAEVKVTIVDKMNKEISSLALTCSASDERFFIDTLYSADGQNAVHFEQFSDELQMKVYDYLESLKLDSKLGTFIFDYKRNYHSHKSVQVLRDLRQFVSHIRDE